MEPSPPGWRLSFQTKVLVPVILILILLAALMLGTINHRITEQLQTDAAQALATADSVFQNSQTIRMKNLLLRYGNVPNDPRFKAVAQKNDSRTMRVMLSDLIKELGGDVVLSLNSEGQRLAGASQDPRLNLAEFESRGGPSIKAALEANPMLIPSKSAVGSLIWCPFRSLSGRMARMWSGSWPLERRLAKRWPKNSSSSPTARLLC